jgi:hypothetical protein
VSVRGIPVQDLPENQDPDFAYVIDEVTGFVTPLAGGPLDKAKETGEEKPAKKRGRPRKTELAKEVGSDVSADQVEKASADAEGEES